MGNTPLRMAKGLNRTAEMAIPRKNSVDRIQSNNLS
jgi:hypothetical protein